MEVAAYKSHPFHVLFIDLVKAFDSVSRSGLWCILRKKGVPPRFLSLLQSYYQDKQTSVSVEGALSPVFSLSTGVGQGCCVAPLLFSLFLSAVMEAWDERTGGRGLRWLTHIDGNLLHRERQDKYGHLDNCDFEHLMYADDAALLADTLLTLADKAKHIQAHLHNWSLSL